MKTRFSDDTKLKKKKLENSFNSKKKIKATENLVTILEGLFDFKENLKKFEVVKTNEEVFEKLLERLPKEYRMEAAILKYALNGGTLNQEKIIQELTIKYEDLNPDDSDEEITDDSEDSSDDEEALIGKTSKAKKSKKTSKGMTQKDVETMVKEAVKAALVSTSQKICSVCGKIGHLKADCFTLPENAEKKKREYFTRLESKRFANQPQGGLLCANRGHATRGGNVPARYCELCGSNAHLSNTSPENMGIKIAQLTEDTEEIAFMCEESDLSDDDFFKEEKSDQNRSKTLCQLRGKSLWLPVASMSLSMR